MTTTPQGATSPASAGEAPLTQDDLDKLDRAITVAWQRWPDYHAACIFRRLDWRARISWTSTLSANDYDTCEYADGTFTFSGRDRDGDGFTALMPGEAVTGTDDEFAVRLVAWKAANDERDAALRAANEQREREAQTDKERAKAAERERIFREEAARRGIEVPS